ncbi:MAG TPA: hypothetical protein VHR45_21690 [Thermoanaerobaculia bacterium]|nr:hypothetical protein [Thermoanaerobaculia bacterium]
MLSLDHQTTHELLSDLSAEHRQALLHIFGCPDCRRQAEESLLPAQPRQRSADEGRYDLPFARQLRHLPRLLDLMFADERRGEELFEELMRLPPHERFKAVRRQPQFRVPELAVHLLKSAEARLPADPEGCEELAGLALGLAARLPEGDPLGRAASARGLAGCLTGEARRRRGDRAGAVEAYEAAAAQLDCPLESELRAAWCAGLAKVRWEERRTDEAAALLGRAATIYAANGQAQAEGVCRALVGFLCLELCEPTCAFTPLEEAYHLLDPAAAPALAARTALAFAYCHAAVGYDESWREQAAGLLVEARRLGAAVTDEGERAGWDWWEARIAARLGDREAALSKLGAVRQRLLAQGSLREAALATLDLAVLKTACAERQDIAELGHELLHAFPESRPFRLAGSFAVLERLAPEDFSSGVEMLRTHLLALRRFRSSRRDLIADVKDVALLPAV